MARRPASIRLPRLAIYSHAASDSVNALKEHYAEQGTNLVKIKRENSNFMGREGDLIINYGSSSFPMERVGAGRLLNSPTAIGLASNKRRAFEALQRNSVKTVEWTADSRQAQGWLENGDMVYARTQLSGHSGSGIVIAYNNPAGVGDAGDVQVVDTLPTAQLYTKAILQQRREFRIHVMNGVITYVQQKRRRDGYRDEANYSNLVRNHHTGWIYATQNADVNDEAKREALKAIEALGLDFGAVDVITRRDEAWVLEVNTAPGMSGTNLETYADNFLRVFRGEEVEGISVDFTALQEEIRNDEPAPAPSRPAPRPTEPERPVSDVGERRVRHTPAEHTVTASAAIEEAQVSAAEPATVASGALTHNGIYILTVSGEVTVGKYDETLQHFEIVGWEVPVENDDEVDVGSLLHVL